ncbi:MAG: class I SAM-dependent methyltransferase [Gammaproteobacteria bacterium]
MNQADIELMNSLNWYHKIELIGGRVTPGREWDHLWSPIKREMHRVDFRGKRVLDIGTWDGLWSFEAESLGASSVLATDINTQRSFTDQGPATFEFAKRIRGSNVEYKEVSVYDLDSLEQQFDIVVFFGVLYHLRYPQLGLARIRNILKDGGLLLMETAILLDTDDTIIQTDHRKIFPNDVSTWNAFSGPALVSLLKESYFEVERFEVILRRRPDRKIGRGFALARATSGVNFHHCFPDRYLHRFFEPYGAASEEAGNTDR